MKKVLLIIGSVVFTALMYCVPILLTCSFLLNFDGFIQLVLVLCAFGQLGAIFWSVYWNASEDKDG